MSPRLNAARRTIRTAFQALIGLAAIAPLVYRAALGQDPALATGWLALALAIAAGISRVMGLPGVEIFLQRYVPWLSAKPPVEPPPDRPETTFTAGV